MGDGGSDDFDTTSGDLKGLTDIEEEDGEEGDRRSDDDNENEDDDDDQNGE